MEERRADPYRTCLRFCRHDLAAGVLVTDLLGRDGPHPALELVWRQDMPQWTRPTEPARLAAG